MKLAIAKAFEVQETRWIRLPAEWGEGEIEVARIGCKGYQDWLAEHSKDNPFVKGFRGLQARRAVLAQNLENSIRARAKSRNLKPAEVDAEVEEALAKLDGELATKTADQVAEQMEDSDLEAFASPAGIAEHLIRNWRGRVFIDADTNETAACTVANRIEFLSLDNPLPQDKRKVTKDDGSEVEEFVVPFAQFGTLGAAARAFVIEEAQKTEEFRVQHAEAVGKA